MQKTTTVLTAYGNSYPVGIAKFSVVHRDRDEDISFYVVRENAPALLGLGACQILDIIRRVDTVRPANDSDILSEFSDLFSGIGTMPGEYHIAVDDSVQPVVHAQGEFHSQLNLS